MRALRRVGGLVGALFAAGLLAATSAGAATYSWSVALSGQAIIDSHLPANPNASGSATITADTSTLKICGTFTWSNVASPVVFGHIHEGEYGVPENPAYTVNLFGPDIFGAPSGVTGCTKLPGAVMSEMAAHPEYFNVVVHNKQYPAGAIRGQLGFLCEEPLCPGPF